MTALWIVGSVLALLILLLSCSIVLRVEIDEEVRLYLGAFGYRKRFGPGVETVEKPPKKKPKKPPKKKKKPPAQAQKKKLEEETVSEKTLGDTVEYILLLVKAVLPGTVKLLSHLRFTSVRIWMTVAGEDADQIAIHCGLTAAGVYNLLAVIDQACILRVKAVDVVPDFVTGEAVYRISFRVKLRLIRILYHGIGILYKLLVNTIRERGKAPVQSASSEKPG